jgi:hypothetical protein
MSLSLLPLMFWLPFAHSQPANPTQTHGAARPQQVGAWTLSVRTDTFAGVTTCRLIRGHTTYERGAVTFHLPPKVDTSAALYRIDGEAPTPAKADNMAIAALGFALWQDDKANPSGAVVRIPAPKLMTARQVQIEPRLRTHQIYSFNVDGLPPALAAAKAKGCG